MLCRATSFACNRTAASRSSTLDRLCRVELCPIVLSFLKAQQEEEQSATATEMCRVLAVLDDELKRRAGQGPYWFGWQVGLTDIAFYPWFERWAVLEHYRGLRIPDHLEALHGWIEAMQGREAVRLGSEPAAYYITEYIDYAADRK